MNRSGAVKSSFVQQMMEGGSHGWWDMKNLRLQPPEQTPPLLPSFSPSSSSSSSPVLPQYPQASHLLPTNHWHENQDLPESWSQLLMGGLVGEEERCGFTPFQASKQMESSETDQLVYPSVKLETSGQGNGVIHASWPWGQILPSTSTRSCVTTSLSSSMLDFSSSKAERRHHQPDHSSECNSTASGAALKKARVQPSSSHSTFKVRKEKLGDRITALHQIVSPFGKTDTASVLLEAIGYIRFLQSQIEVFLSLSLLAFSANKLMKQWSWSGGLRARNKSCGKGAVLFYALCCPYLGCGSSSGSTRQPAQGGRNCIFPDDPGQLLNTSMKKRGASDQDASHEAKRDLRSRGLCLVPVSCTMHVGSDNGADYWAPTLGGGFP